MGEGKRDGRRRSGSIREQGGERANRLGETTAARVHLISAITGTYCFAKSAPT